MALTPDEIYWQKAATEAVAPVTLWVYPELRHVESLKQRSVLEKAKRKALRHWLSSVLMWGAVVVAAARFGRQVTEVTTRSNRRPREPWS